MAKFFFRLYEGSRVARIFLKKSFSNFFLTLTDLNGNVIVSVSSGSVNQNVSKKRKLSHYSIEPVFKVLLDYLREHKILYLELFLKLRISAHVFSLVRELNFYGFSVSKVVEINKIPHMESEEESVLENNVNIAVKLKLYKELEALEEKHKDVGIRIRTVEERL